MGWWPFSNSSSANTNATPDTTSPPPLPTTTTTSTPRAPAPTPPKPSEEDEFHAAFPHLAPQPASSTPSPDADTYKEPTNPSESSYPTKMSCTAAFDAAFYCSSLGGHFNDIYRYGELRSCSEHWRDWRFCMGLSVYSKNTQAEMIRQHYKEKEDQLRAKPNSEDIWERRGEGERVIPFRFAEEEASRVEKS